MYYGPDPHAPSRDTPAASIYEIAIVTHIKCHLEKYFISMTPLL